LAISESIVEIKRLLTEAIQSADDNMNAVGVSIICNFDVDDAAAADADDDDGRTKEAREFVTKADASLPRSTNNNNRLKEEFRNMMKLVD
jgi:hypothetical protein